MINIHNYNELKKYYNNVLNKDKSIFKTSNDEPTPIECIEEMFSKFPFDILLKNSNIKILDPCCGNGNFHLVLYDILISKYHFTHDKVINSIYFNDINDKRLENVIDIWGNDINITNQNFLEYDENNFYDLIIANPPYAKFTNGKRTSKNHNLIQLFLEKSLKILKSNGFLMFITQIIGCHVLIEM